jgi:GTP-binding protein Era
MKDKYLQKNLDQAVPEDIVPQEISPEEMFRQMQGFEKLGFEKLSTENSLPENINLDSNKTYRSGFVALVGRPNVGKSSLLNKLIGQKIAIVSPKVQTTRNKILGVYNFYENDSNRSEGIVGQLVFIDLPGIHKPQDKLGEACLKISQDGAREADLIVFMSEANHSPGKGDQWIIDWLRQNCYDSKYIILLNKVDLAKRKDRLKADRQAYLEMFADLPEKPQLIEISTVTGEGLEELKQSIWDFLPEGPLYFPEDAPTNLSMRFLTAELIREQVLHLTQEEVPHSVAIRIDDYVEKANAKNLTKIFAKILVETESQKGIIIGKNGSLIKEIGSKARIEIETLIKTPVFLELKVKVAPQWRQNERELGRMELS